MGSNRRLAVFTAVLVMSGFGTHHLWGQEDALTPSVLHIQHSVTTSQLNFPSYLYMYHGLGGAKSTAEAQTLTGTISLENHSPNFSEVLWLLLYRHPDRHPALSQEEASYIGATQEASLRAFRAIGIGVGAHLNLSGSRRA